MIFNSGVFFVFKWMHFANLSVMDRMQGKGMVLCWFRCCKIRKLPGAVCRVTVFPSVPVAVGAIVSSE